MNMLCSLRLLVFGSLYLSSHASERSEKKDPWLGWHRPVDANVFATTMGNNHDSVLFVEPELEYPYHLIVSHTPNLLISGEPRNSHGAVKTGNWYPISIKSETFMNMMTVSKWMAPTTSMRGAKYSLIPDPWRIPAASGR